MNTLLLYSPVLLWIRVLGAVGPLIYASISDFRTRMVEHEWTWLLMIIIGSIVAIFEALLFQDFRILLDLAMNVGLSFAIAFLLFYAGLFGGADGKALISLSFLFPRTPPVFLEWGIRPLLPFFFLTILSNALLLTVLVPISLFVKNLIDYLKGNSLFSGLEHEAFWKKALTLFIGFRIPLSRVFQSPHVYPLLDLVDVNGVLTLRLNIGVDIEDKKDMDLNKIKEFLNEVGEENIKNVWVSPGIPFIIPITLSLCATLMIGDLLLLTLYSLHPYLI